jgi:hypothetical protein
LLPSQEELYSRDIYRCSRETGDYKNNNEFKPCIYLNTVFEFIIVVAFVYIIARFSAAP